MIRQYGAQRSRGGDNPLRVGVVAAGSIFYLQDEAFFRDRHGGTAVCRTPWIVEGFLNGRWEDVFLSGRSDMVLLRSLRDRRQMRRVAVRTLILHDDLGLTKGVTAYPTLPDVHRFRPMRFPRVVASQAPRPFRRAA